MNSRDAPWRVFKLYPLHASIRMAKFQLSNALFK